MKNKWSEQFNVPYPDCNMCGKCCRCASPSTPTQELIKRAENKDTFAKDFLDIFIPYSSIDEARKVCQETVERSIKACEKPDTKVKKEQLVFYHCKYISDDNKCLIHEDRPNLCRDFPDMPFLIFPQGCAYENWSKECKQKYNHLQEDLKTAKEMQKEIENLKIQYALIRKYAFLSRTDNENYKFSILFPDLFLVSPRCSLISKY
jgi:Fe-S-cluster containining protein